MAVGVPGPVQGFPELVPLALGLQNQGRGDNSLQLVLVSNFHGAGERGSCRHPASGKGCFPGYGGAYSGGLFKSFQNLACSSVSLSRTDRILLLVQASDIERQGASAEESPARKNIRC